jgi:hypothetical protein
MSPHLPLNLGAIESKDPRNVPLGAVQTPTPYPVRLRTDVSKIPTYYQNGQPACGGHAGAWFKSYLDWLNLELPIARSPRFIYDWCKLVDGFPNDEGTTLNAIFKVLRDRGAPELSLFPNDIHLSKQQYRDPANIPAAANLDAAKNKTGPWAYLSDLSLDGVKRAIWQNQAVILLIWCDDGFFGTNTPTFTEKKYGHFVAGYNYDEGGAFIVDSTEPTTSLSFKYVPHSAFTSGFIRQGATAVDIPNWQLLGLTSQTAVIRWITARLAFLESRLKGR